MQRVLACSGYCAEYAMASFIIDYVFKRKKKRARERQVWNISRSRNVRTRVINQSKKKLVR